MRSFLNQRAEPITIFHLQRPILDEKLKQTLAELKSIPLPRLLEERYRAIPSPRIVSGNWERDWNWNSIELMLSDSEKLGRRIFDEPVFADCLGSQSKSSLPLLI